jgi:hypothetical protein
LAGQREFEFQLQIALAKNAGFSEVVMRHPERHPLTLRPFEPIRRKLYPKSLSAASPPQASI